MTDIELLKRAATPWPHREDLVHWPAYQPRDAESMQYLLNGLDEIRQALKVPPFCLAQSRSTST